MRIVLAPAAALLFAVLPPALFNTAKAALLRPFSEIGAATVHLADLFDDLGATPDRVLGPAPAPGARIVVDAPQLAAIARDFGVDWRPGSGAERSIIERHGVRLPAAAVGDPLRRALEDSGAPALADIAMPSFEPVTVPAGSTPHTEISDLSYERTSGRFTALVAVTADGMAPVALRVSGQAVPTMAAAVASHALAAGAVLTASDAQPARLHASLLHGHVAVPPNDFAGMIVHHPIAAGAPLTTADVGREILVAHGATVKMSLRSAGIDLSMQATALDQGALGERIRVLNPSSRIIVMADVTAPGEVRAMPGGNITVSATP